MKAIVSTAYGPPDVLQLREVPSPIPKDNEVRIKIHAATVTAGDCEMRKFDMPGWIWLPLRLYMGILNPRINILGQELAGEVDAIGKAVTRFKKGDRVFAPTQMSLGAHAEYICLPENAPISIVPVRVSFEEAATLPTGGLNGLHFIRKAKLQRGEEILINGAGGSIGTYAVQIAKSQEAEVTAVDSAIKLEMLRSIGADNVIDYAQEDFTRSGKRYDVILDVIGKSPFYRSLKSLKPKGRYIQTNPRLSTMLRAPWVSLFSDKKAMNVIAPYRQEDLDHLRQLLETGKIRAVIDKRFPLAQMSEAHRYIEKGLKAGNVVITVGSEN